MPPRFRVVLLAVLINMVCYTDRVCIAVAGPEMRKEFGFSQTEMGLVFSIFSLSYALGQTPWGIAADKFGARGIVAFAIAGWSAFTALTATAWNLVSLLLIRFVFGGLEAAFSPSVASAFTRWVPVNERATAFGLFLGGGRLGGAITPPIAGFLLLHYGWRMPFVAFGTFGLIWAAIWYAVYRNAPAERTAPAPVAWGLLLTSRRLWCLLIAAFGATFMWQFYITWFPTYLREQRGMSLTESSYYASLPLLLGVGANWLGGLLTDWLSRRRGDRQARTIVGFVSMTAGASLMSAGVWCADPALAGLLMGCAAGAVDLYLGAAWSSATDIGGASGGAVAGLMNAASNGAGFASPVLMGFVLQRTQDWNAVLYLSVATTFCAAISWLFVNPRRQEA